MADVVRWYAMVFIKEEIIDLKPNILSIDSDPTKYDQELFDLHHLCHISFCKPGCQYRLQLLKLW